MSSATATTTQTNLKNAFQVLTANEWGQVTNLEANAQYFVIRKPTREMTKEKSREFVEDVKAFLHEHKVLTDQQIKEINERYAEPAKAKALQVRETVEKRFDEITKEFETRVEKLEAELGERADRLFRPAKPATGTGNETPGEMPTGESHAAEPATETTAQEAEKPRTGKKGKKNE